MTTQTTWTEYTGSDDQIAEMKRGFITRDINGIESENVRYINEFVGKEHLKNYLNYQNITHYWIIPDDPLREMKIRQAQTGQPVWVRVHGVVHQTTNPNWNWANAEYSFTEFKD